MDEMALLSDGRERSIYRYGNSFVSHIICQKINKGIWADSYPNIDDFYKNTLPTLAENYILQLKNAIEREYSDSMIVYVLRNYNKCRHLKTLMT